MRSSPWHWRFRWSTRAGCGRFATVSEAGTAVAERPAAARISWLVTAYGPTLAIAVLVFLVGYDSGGYAQSTRDELAIGL
jgi:hypothetical protein